MINPVTAQGMVDDVRVMSGLRNNPLFSDDQICELLNDAYDEMRDRFVASGSHWFRSTVTFTLSGNGPGQNTFDLTTIPDFQMDQGLNFYPGGLTAPPVPVNRLGSFAERGRAEGTVALGYIGDAREYFTNGDTLFVDPYTASAGTYKLIYTPQKVPLSIEVVANTTQTLPALLAPWQLYLKLHASIAIMQSRKQTVTADMQTKFNLQDRRLTVMAQQRSEGPKQAPITRRRRRWGFTYLG